MHSAARATAHRAEGAYTANPGRFSTCPQHDRHAEARSPGIRHQPHRGPANPSPAGHFTGFHVPHRSVVNCPSDDRIVTVIFRALVAKLLSMISPDSLVRSQ